MMIMGGAKGGYFNTIERFDGDTWTPLSNNLTYGRKLHCSVAICSTEVLVIGGYFTSSYISAMEKNDINGNHIETLPSMELARSSSGCGVYNNEVYVTGGFNSTGLSSVEVYNNTDDKLKCHLKYPYHSVHFFLEFYISSVSALNPKAGKKSVRNFLENEQKILFILISFFL